jgi:hypothetical protein
MDPDVLQAEEERFWKGDADFYRKHLAPDALMVFAEPIGVLTRERIIEAVASTRRWASVRFDNVRFIKLDEHAVIMTYTAYAEREGDGTAYSALVSSAYVQRGGSWTLVFHQQTPGGGGDG